MQVIHTTLNKKQKVEYYSHACDVQLLSVSFFVVVLFIIDFIYTCSVQLITSYLPHVFTFSLATGADCAEAGCGNKTCGHQ